MATTTLTELQTLPTNHTLLASQHAVSLSTPASVEGNVDRIPTGILPKNHAAIVITTLVGIQLFTSFCNGIIVIGLPTMAKELNLQAGLLLWPTSVFYLTAGSCLMFAGSIADVVGTKSVILAANVLLVGSSLGCGLARNGAALIAFRGLQGVSSAMAVPASVSIVSTSIEYGRPRNLGFACLGFSGPLGFLLGLVLGGVAIEDIGWRSAFYTAAVASFFIYVVGVRVLPKNTRADPATSVSKQLAFDVDWVGACIASTGLATLSYVMATLSAAAKNIRHPSNIALLVLSLATLPAFIWWMNYQVKHARPALIPNSVWRNTSFTSVCIMCLLTSAVCNCMELFSSLFFQNVQGNSALTTSLHLLPALVTAVATNLTTGYFVNRMPIMWVVMVSAALSAGSPLVMAVIKPELPYWDMAFIAQVLEPLNSDILFTVGLLVISAVFPPETQALGGAVFNTCAQLGSSIGLTITSVIAGSRTAASSQSDKDLPTALMIGYRAVFWALFAWMACVCLVAAVGLRRVGKIGTKQD